MRTLIRRRDGDDKSGEFLPSGWSAAEVREAEQLLQQHLDLLQWTETSEETMRLSRVQSV